MEREEGQEGKKRGRGEEENYYLFHQTVVRINKNEIISVST